jgi:hypothetical protein
VGHRGRGRPHHKGAPNTTTALPARPAYPRPHELYAGALSLLVDRLEYTAGRGDVAGWCLARAWAQVALAWWTEVPR